MSLHYVFDHPPAAGCVHEVVQGVFWARLSLPSSLEHINVWILEDGNGWTIIDCGIGTAALKEAWDRLFRGALADRPVTRVFVTHAHSDHVGLAQWHCERAGARCWISEGEYRQAQRLISMDGERFGEVAARHYRCHGVTDEDVLAGVRREPSPFPALVPGLPGDPRFVEDNEVIAIGGRDWRTLAGQGHCPDHRALFCKELQVLVAGDYLLPRITPYVGVGLLDPEDNPLPKFLQSVQRFLQLPAKTMVLPSHGDPFRGVQTRVAQLLLHHEQRLARILEGCTSAQTATEIVRVVFPRPLGPREFILALGEVLAHLHALEARGAVERTDEKGCLRWVKR